MVQPPPAPHKDVVCVTGGSPLAASLPCRCLVAALSPFWTGRYRDLQALLETGQAPGGAIDVGSGHALLQQVDGLDTTECVSF